MLPRQYRLPARVRLTHPHIYASPYFTVKSTSNELPLNRFGFIIGKAVAKEAVTRNRARRLIRSCVEERLEAMKPGHDMLFLMKKGIIGIEREILLSELDKFLTEKKLLISK